MNVEQFLQEVLPSDGFNCAVGIKNGVTKHIFSTGIVGLLEAARDFDNSGHDVYFACHTFSDQRRLQAYALKCRSFYLDLDCGEDKAKEGKGYATKSEAVTALRKFCKDLNLPKPYIIDSGRGLHVYWMLNEAVESKVWTPVARAFKSAALKLGLVIDPAVPADSARMLRVPGTHNHKNKEEPLDVKIVTPGSNIDFDFMREAVKDYMPKERTALTPRPMDAISKSLMGNYESNFALLVRKSLKGTGCAQIAHALREAATLDEPLWHAALSIAVRCNDGAKAIHNLSKAHPEYDPDETQKKAENTGGPRTCAWYKIESGNGKLCEGCERKVSSPIQIGRVVVESKPEPAPAKPAGEALPAAGIASLFGNQSALPTPPEESEEPQEQAAPSQGIVANLPVLEQTIPEIPFPYFRGKNGGIYMHTKDSEGERTDVLIFEDDLYVTKRIVDPNAGMCAVIQLHSPHDPIKEFAVPLKNLQAKDKFRDTMSEKGIVANEKGMGALMAYTTAFVKSLRKATKADEARTQFGWCDANTKFILGNREFSAKSVNYSPSSSVTESLAPHMAEKGSYDEWRKAFNMYHGYENAEPHIFALMSAFGSPLMKFSGIAGSLISLVNTTSGTGKTSIQRLINSVMGHPDELMQVQKDSEMTKIHRMGVMNSLCNCFDEMTNHEPKSLSDLVYAITQGRGRNRMRADANLERVNTTRWAGISVCSGNASIIDKLGANKATSDGEMMRVLEYKVPLVIVAEAPDYLANLHENYGFAGGIYVETLVKNVAQLSKWIDKMRERLMKRMKSVTKERFWINTAACNLVGGYISKQLGLHDYDMEAIFEWVAEDLLKQRAMVESHITGATDMLGEYLLENYGHTLIINMAKLSPITQTNVFKHPVGKIAARFEMDTNCVYIPKKDFKEYCVRRQGDLESALHGKNKDYKFGATIKKRIAAGTGMISPAIDVYEFKVSAEMASALLGPEVTGNGT